MPFDSGGGGDANVPDWAEDGNSPQTNSSSGDQTYTLATNEDMVLVFVKATAGGSNVNLDLQVNGDTGNNYDNTDHGGAGESGASQWNNIQFLGANETQQFAFTIAGSDGRLGYEEWAGGGGGGKAAIGGNGNVSLPVTQFTLLSTNTKTINRIEVYTRNVD